MNGLPGRSRIADLLASAQARGLDRLDAQLLMLLALGRPRHDRAWLLAHDQDVVAADAADRFGQATARRLAGEPVAYLSGRKEFFGLDLAVDARVLVPRPDTEILVEWALACIATRAAPRVLDLGTGSGAIALAIRQARPDAQVLAADASAAALEVARGNGARLGLAVDWLQSDWLDAVPPGEFDLVVSNPPYVASGDAHLAALRHEPLSALASGADGLDAIRRIVRDAPARLAPGAWLLLEHGHDQAAAVASLLAGAGLEAGASRPDLAGIPRCTGARRPTVK